jgi:hypothetical protein
VEASVAGVGWTPDRGGDSRGPVLLYVDVQVPLTPLSLLVPAAEAGRVVVSLLSQLSDELSDRIAVYADSDLAQEAARFCGKHGLEAADYASVIENMLVQQVRSICLSLISLVALVLPLLSRFGRGLTLLLPLRCTDGCSGCVGQGQRVPRSLLWVRRLRWRPLRWRRSRFARVRSACAHAARDSRQQQVRRRWRGRCIARSALDSVFVRGAAVVFVR